MPGRAGARGGRIDSGCPMANAARGGRTLPAGGAVVLRVTRRARGLRRGEGAGLPQQDELLQPAENAYQAGDDQVMHRRWNPDTLLLCLRIAAQAGDPVAQDGGWSGHSSYTNRRTIVEQGNFALEEIFFLRGGRGDQSKGSLLFVDKKKQKNFIRLLGAS